MYSFYTVQMTQGEPYRNTTSESERTTGAQMLDSKWANIFHAAYFSSLLMVLLILFVWEGTFPGVLWFKKILLPINFPFRIS